ncbi:hypothetical protein [Flavihumibacter cheonanensis]|uniref:hypothetical protein n=1 Tax=Flavihumibacter cheonanensis TaxID=1442385 RepID=UPI001EF8FE8B|nr:hypothetical protein [Flavihumibacter cheonanensis]MCG7753492.1 hypothetical protein [Flavihumibacter cheonanensis]
MMHKLFLIILILFQSFLSTGQISSGKSPSALSDSVEFGGNPNCIYKLTYNPTERLQLFPFVSAHEVWLVSFPYFFDKNIPLLSFDRLAIDSSIFKETAKLTAGAVDSLTDILYNLSYSHQIDSLNGYPILYAVGEKDCYMPRNAILFIDLKGKTFGYIELCFECNRHRESSKAIQTGDFCLQKYNQLKLYFIQHSVK